MFDPHTDCNICKADNNNNQEGSTTMIDISSTITDPELALWEKDLLVSQEVSRREQALREKIAELQIERDEARNRRDRYATELSSMRDHFQGALSDFAKNHLDSSDESYSDLNGIMQDAGLEGLKRTFEVTVRVTYEFTVEVEATDEQEAQDEVDNDITTYAGDNVNPGWDSPYYSEFEVSEA